MYWCKNALWLLLGIKSFMISCVRVFRNPERLVSKRRYCLPCWCFRFTYQRKRVNVLTKGQWIIRQGNLSKSKLINKFYNSTTSLITLKGLSRRLMSIFSLVPSASFSTFVIAMFVPIFRLFHYNFRRGMKQFHICEHLQYSRPCFELLSRAHVQFLYILPFY